MAQNQDIRTGRHCVFSLHVHLVFVTKFRRGVLEQKHLDAMEAVFRSVCEDFESTLAEFNGEADHVHLLVTYPPKVSVSSLVNSLKGVSSRLLRKEFGDFHPWLKRRGMLWSPSYFAGSCGGAPLEILKTYIEQQKGQTSSG